MGALKSSAEAELTESLLRRKFLTSNPLHWAALQGDWKAAEALLLEDASMLTSPITLNGDTLLYVASLAGHEYFVQKLLLMMSEEELLNTNCFIAPLQKLANNPTCDIPVCRLLLDCLRGAEETNISNETRRAVETMMLRSAKSGNAGLLVEIIDRYLEVVFEGEEVGRDIFYAAVSNCQEHIYTYLLEFPWLKRRAALHIDASGNNILHVAANLGPAAELNNIPGIDLQIKSEWLWFQEVEKIVPHRYKTMKNQDGHTPHELFVLQHKSLVEKGKKTLKQTAKSMIIAPMVMAALTCFFIFPRYESYGRVPNLRDKWVTVFAVVKTVALTSSLSSVFAFLSIITKDIVASDFVTFLPCVLLAGLIFTSSSMLALVISDFMLMGIHDDPLSVSIFAVGFAALLFAVYHLLAPEIRHEVSSRRLLSSGKRSSSIA